MAEGISNKSKLVVVSAPSGAGKTTLCARLLRDFPELQLSISCTTRAPRGNEVHGKEYFFLSRKEFEAEIQAGRFAEWALVHGNYYGTSRSFIDQTFSTGRSVLLDIDVQGAASLRKAYEEKCYTAFIAPPSLEVLEKRLRARKTDSDETIQKRVRNAAQEMREQERFEKIIVNDDLDRAYSELKAAVSEQLRGAGQDKDKK